MEEVDGQVQVVAGLVRDGIRALAVGIQRLGAHALGQPDHRREPIARAVDELDAGAFDRAQRLQRIGQFDGDGLFDENVFSGPRRRLDQPGMMHGADLDQDGINPGIAQDSGGIRGRVLAAVRLKERLGFRLVEIAVGHRLRSGDGGQVRAVDLRGHGAAADHAEAQVSRVLRSHRPGLLRVPAEERHLPLDQRQKTVGRRFKSA